MKFNLSINTLLKLSNNEAVALLAVAASLAFNPKSIIDDFIRLSTFGYDSTFKYLKKFEEEGLIRIERHRGNTGNRYKYIEPKDKYITIDSSIFKVNLSRTEIGSLIRLKCWSRVNTNIVDLSLNRIVHEIGVLHCSIYRAMEEGILKRSEKKLYFEFTHPSLMQPA